MRFAVRAAYPEEGGRGWDDIIRSFEPVGWVEVAFANPGLFESVPVEAVVEPFETSSVRAAAVHMAYAKVSDLRQFERTLSRTLEIADRLAVRHIVAHPNRGRLSDVLSFLDGEISPLLRSSDKILCWEVFDNRRRILGGLKEVVAFCRERQNFRACYDFSHVNGSQSDVESEVLEYLDWIAHFHVSNRVRAGRIQHLPVFWNEEAGDFGRDLDLESILRLLAGEGYAGTVTLEYQSQFDSRLVPDALRLIEIFPG